ncbi:putative 3 -5 exonuclease protein [Botrytis fragariae]|uniref:Putative 3 -5 exonuclease protein n=1 Tax=Botrytis fragariae TaxID=1964551 RepID=A0A8H6B3L6_9HELO|nr:putative 3 -5 exonuclease protein [Botrytis fragariae]KAF5878560.1 putative 3 -5 exonuclease protein [Botrytis fragariae]
MSLSPTQHQYDTKHNPYLEWAASWSDYVEEILAEKERDLALENGDSSEDLEFQCYEFDWDVTRNSDDSRPQSGDSWERQPMVSFADEYEARMVWWDVRNDFEALSHHYNIHPHFDLDLQLLDIMSARGNRARLNSLIASVRKNQAGESRMNDPTMWRGYSGKWSSKKKEVKDYLDWNGFEALETRPVNPILILGCRIDTEILPELFDHLLQRLEKTTNEMMMGYPELFLNIVREESWIRAQAVWSRKSSNVYVAGICQEIMNHPRTQSPPIFTMLPQVIAGIREDEFMIGFE